MNENASGRGAPETEFERQPPSIGETTDGRSSVADVPNGAVYQSLFDDAPHATIIMSPKGVVQYANSTACSLVGRTAAELVGQTYSSTPWWPDSGARARVQDAITRAASGELVRFDTTRSDDPTRRLEFTLRPVKDKNSRIVALVAEQREIAELDHGSIPGQGSQLVLDAVLEQSPVPIVVVNVPDLVVRHFNRAAVTALGIDDEPSIINRSLSDIRERQTWQDLPWDETVVDPERLPLRRIVRGETVSNLEYSVLRKDQTRVWFLVGGAPVRDYDGSIVAAVVVFRDVTEHKNALEQLRNLADEQRTILDTVTAGICLVRDGRVQWVNPAFTAILGYTSEELGNTDPTDLYQGNDEARLRERVRGAFEAGQVCTTELPMRRKSGDLLWCSLSGRAIDPKRLDQGSIWVLQDITVRREADEALRTSQARLDAAQAQSRVGSWDARADFQRGFWSAEMFRLFNLDPASPPPSIEEFLEMVHPDDRPLLMEAHRKVIELGEPQRLIYRTNPQRRALKVFEVNMRSLPDATGRTARVAGTLQDVTERHQAEESLRQSEARLEAAQALAHIGSWEFDPKTKANVWSKEMVRLAGVEPPSDPSRAFVVLDLVHPEDRARVRAVYDRAIQTGEPGRCEFRSAPWRGPERFFSMTCEVSKNSFGEPLHVSGTLQDITERKHAEKEQARLQDELLQASKMEAVGRLAGGVAHDFNNLLTVIAGNIELARMELNPTDPLRQPIEEVGRAAASAADLTRQLLAFSRRQIIEPRVLGINDLVNGLRKMLGRLIGENITFQTSLSPDVGLVKVDPGQFDQVVVNLVVNARDAMPRGGYLLIETANVSIDEAACKQHAALQPGNFVMLAVSDTGQGMTSEVKSRVFEPFFTTKGQGRGTGLGLAMIFGVVKQAGGAIDVYSEVGRGTTFKIYLPRVEGTAEPRPRPTVSPEPPVGHETVLLVEDEKSVRELSRVFLQRQGYSVLVAANANEAMVCAKECPAPIDLLLTDVVLPGMNGRELAEHILVDHPEMSVLFTSGYTPDSVIRHGVMSDQVHFIGKPYSLQGLAKKVREILDACPSTTGAPSFARRSRAVTGTNTDTSADTSHK